MPIYEDITKTVGNTPLVRLRRICKGCSAEVLVKLESFNPLSSVKDRIGVAMIEDAEKRGQLKEGSVLDRAHQRQYGYRSGVCRCIAGLPAHSDHARYDEYGETAIAGNSLAPNWY